MVQTCLVYATASQGNQIVVLETLLSQTCINKHSTWLLSEFLASELERLTFVPRHLMIVSSTRKTDMIGPNYDSFAA